MKPAKQQEAKARIAHDLYWESYLKGDVETLASLLDNDYTQIGSVEEEVFFTKKDAVQFVVTTIDQIAGNVQMRNRVTKSEPVDDFILFSEQCDLYVLSEGEWTFYSKFRASSLMKLKDGSWKMVHQHSSLPDSKAQDGENIAIEKITTENLELRDAIKRRTVELESKNRELQIEAALERVRSTSLAMYTTSDLSKVVYVVFTELVKLDAKLDRCLILTVNSQTLGITWYLTGKEGLLSNNGFLVPNNQHPSHQAYLEGWRTKRKKWRYLLAGEEKKLVDAYGFSETELAQLPDFIKADMAAVESIHLTISSDDFGCLIASSLVPLSEAHAGIVDRFTTVFNQTYTRFLDLQKAEAQAREAQIEAALEKVRSRSLAMQKSTELNEVASVLFDQIRNLGGKLWGTGFALCNVHEGQDEFWFANATGVMPPVKIPNTEDDIHIAMLNGWIEKQGYFTFQKEGDALAAHYQYLNSLPQVKAFFEPMLEAGYQFPAWQQWHAAYFSQGYLLFITVETYPEPDIFKRFAKVFDQTYTRFLDLQKAEAQAREAKIEAALERVRARTMAMQHSNELKDAAALLFQQVEALGVPVFSCGYNIWEKDEKEFTAWMTNNDGSGINPAFSLPLAGDANFIRFHQSRQQGEEFYVLEMRGERMQEHYRYLIQNVPVFKETFENILKAGQSLPETQIHHIVNFSHGNVMFITFEPCPEAYDIFKRFGKVFEQTFSRFLDLQKAEAQARESQIEAALERVRSRTMGMQKSGELREVIQVIFEQFQNLGIDLYGAAFAMDYMESEDWFIWSADIANLSPTLLHIPYFDHPYWNSWNDARRKGLDSLTYTMELEEKNNFVSEFAKYIPDLPAEVFQSVVSTPGYTVSNVFLKNVTLYIDRFNTEPFSDADNAILMRFGKVFEQTYTRFKDLEKAEAQAREAQIEAALEKVRSRTMAMQRSEELPEVAGLLFQQVKTLGVPQFQCGFNIFEIDDKECIWYPGSADGDILPPCKIPLTEHPIFMAFNESRKRGDELYVYEKEGEYQAGHYRYMLSLPVLGEMLQNMLDAGIPFPTFQIDHIANFSHGNLLFITSEHFPEMHDTFKRFAKVFEQTYTRFLDLQKAEAQAREAEISLALERVRARTLAMQRSEELIETSLELWKQVDHLGIPAFGCGFNIWDADKKFATAWMGGNKRTQPSFKTDSNQDIFKRIHEAERKGDSLFVEIQEGEAVKEHYSYMNSIPVFKNIADGMEEAGLSFPDFQIMHCSFFAQGYLMFITFEPVPWAYDIFKRFAKVFEQTYTRFLDLQKAEAQAREAKIEAALERVRSRTMAMQHSYELTQVAGLLFDQVSALGIKTWTAGFNVWSEDNNSYVDYITSPNGGFIEPYTVHTERAEALRDIANARKSGVEFDVLYVEGEKIKQLYLALTQLDEKQYEIMLQDGVSFPSQQYEHFVFGSKVSLMFITYEPVPEAHDIFKRLGKVFEQTYTRFLDLQKAEAQAKEAQIETSLERVRSRTMAMQSSSELGAVAAELFAQMNQLVTNLWTCGFVLCEKNRDEDEWWLSMDGDFTRGFFLPNVGDYAHATLYEGWVKGEALRAVQLDGEPLQQHYDWLMEIPLSRAIFEEMDAAGLARPDWQKLHAAYFSKGYLVLITRELCGEEEIFKRFAQVFDQTYTRFLDLQKAESQAREAKIEAALERVRSRTMAMHHTKELKEVIQVVFDQFVSLNIHVEHAGFILDYKEREDMHIWLADHQQGVPTEITFPYFDSPHWNSYLEAKANQETFFANLLPFEVKNKFYRDLFCLIPELTEEAQQAIFNKPALAISTVLLDNVGLYIEHYSVTPFTPDENALLMRFGKVFQQTYTRFLDLKKAESQAREAQIQLSLERIRAKAMAMQHSDELSGFLTVVFEQFNVLNLNPVNCHLNFLDIENNRNTFRITGKRGTALIATQEIDLDASPLWKKRVEDWKAGHPNDVDVLYVPYENRQEIGEIFKELLSKLPEEDRPLPEDFPDGLYVIDGYCRYGYLGYSASRPPSDEEKEITRRIANEFGNVYQRFLDLQKAEAQAREAQIENALEKVRSRTMAMQRSDELTDVAGLLFNQVSALGIKTWTAGFNVWSEDNNSYVDYLGLNGEIYGPNIVHTEKAEALKELSNARKSGVEFEVIYVEGEKIKQLYLAISGIDEKEYDKMVKDGLLPSQQYEHFVFGAKVSVMFITYEPVPEAHDIFKRLGKVFEQTYTRFLDLQKAEAQAREAQIENALEKVRSRTMAMQHSDELAEAAFVLFQQLQALGVVHERINIGVVKEESKSIDFWITEQGGNQINTRFTGRIDEPTTLAKMIKGWKKNQKSMVIDLTGDDLANWLKYLKEEIGIPFDPAFLHNRRVQTVGFFSKGMLVLTTPEPLPEENLRLLEKFAGVFDLTYTRFSDLKHAEAQAREAQVEVALERIRARALAMQSSTELSDVAKVLRDQMGILGQEDLEASVVHLYSSGSPTFDSWYAFRAGDKILEGQATFRIENSALAKEFLKLYEDEVTEYTIEVKGEKLKQWLAEIKRNAPKIAAYWGDLPPEKQFYHFSDFSGGALLMVSHQNLSEETRMLQKRCASVFELAYKRFLDLEAKERQDKELREEKLRLEQALSELKATQSQLVQQEKLASLGQLTAGIAHEIKNPLNFVNNFSEVSMEMMGEIKEERAKSQDARDETLVDEILDDIEANLVKIHEHGTRANGIVTSMLQHSRGGNGKMEPTDLNALIKEYVNLSFHGMRAGKNPIDVEIVLELEPEIGEVPLIKEDFTRVIINLCNNAFDAMREKILKTEDRRRKTEDGDSGNIKYDPKLMVITSLENGQVQISFEDNGPGIPDEIKDKILQPFFTTKKGTEGTGLGLSITNDIIKAHGGELKVDTQQGEGSTFIIQIPIN